MQAVTTAKVHHACRLPLTLTFANRSSLLRPRSPIIAPSAASRQNSTRECFGRFLAEFRSQKRQHFRRSLLPAAIASTSAPQAQLTLDTPERL